MSEKKHETLRVAITSGDINGIGVETILRVFSDLRMTDLLTPVIYAHPEVIRYYKKINNIEEFQYNGINTAAEAVHRKVNLINAWKEYKGIPEPGKATREAGEFSFRSLEMAVQDLASNKVDVLVTAPINKDMIQSRDFSFPGHTEYLAKIAGTDKVLMFLVSSTLKVGIVTGHLPLKDVAPNITKEKILGKLALMQESLIRDFTINKPRIAVLGLNPHAGDNGLLGNEEKEIIAPAVREAYDKGMYVFGPYGADGFFGSGTYTQFDAVLAMYHDQGLTPFKALAFDSGVNYTAGLPIVRTSPDHGTGYDIAGKGKADESSLRAAIFLACDIYRSRKRYREMSANPLQKQDVRESRDDRRE
ncbi:MAG: 4-hydroxythreonine-4-phosphate dehydrogenase PdxA [Crocinitomicaceae bacterium]|nr:4-hydroxythreonine-4-phosphate dehydrogenase PdxA [Crocinitomicaceae bacterium]